MNATRETPYNISWEYSNPEIGSCFNEEVVCGKRELDEAIEILKLDKHNHGIRVREMDPMEFGHFMHNQNLNSI